MWVGVFFNRCGGRAENFSGTTCGSAYQCQNLPHHLPRGRPTQRLLCLGAPPSLWIKGTHPVWSQPERETPISPAQSPSANATKIRPKQAES